MKKRDINCIYIVLSVCLVLSLISSLIFSFQIQELKEQSNQHQAYIEAMRVSQASEAYTPYLESKYGPILMQRYGPGEAAQIEIEFESGQVKTFDRQQLVADALNWEAQNRHD